MPGIGGGRLMVCDRHRASLCTTGRPLPLRLAGQTVTSPARIGQGVGMGHSHHRKRTTAVDAGIGSARMAPLRTSHVAPPLPKVALARQSVGHDENHRSRQAHLGRQPGVLRRIHWPLGDGDVSGGADELRELVVADFGTVHPEASHCLFAHRLLLRINRVAEGELATGHPHHAGVFVVGRLLRQRALRTLGLCQHRRCLPTRMPNPQRGRQSDRQRGGEGERPPARAENGNSWLHGPAGLTSVFQLYQ